MSMTPSPKSTSPRFPKWAWFGSIAVLTVQAIIVVEWVQGTGWRHKLDWPTIFIGIGVPVVSGAIGWFRSHQSRVQQRNEAAQLENAKRIEGIENQVDRVVIELGRFEGFARADAATLEQLRELQRKMDSHLEQYGHPLLAADFRVLQRSIEKLRAEVKFSAQISTLSARIEDLTNGGGKG